MDYWPTQKKLLEDSNNTASIESAHWDDSVSKLLCPCVCLCNFSPTRPSGPSWSGSRKVCVFICLFGGDEGVSSEFAPSHSNIECFSSLTEVSTGPVALSVTLLYSIITLQKHCIILLIVYCISVTLCFSNIVLLTNLITVTQCNTGTVFQ